MNKKPVAMLTIQIIALALIGGLAHSQPPSGVERATRQTDELGRAEEKMEKELMRRPKPAPKRELEPIVVKKEGEAFFVKAVKLEGCESFDPEEFDPIIKKYTGRELTFPEIDALAEEIGREYLKKGVIAAVFVPPQDIIDETVILRVVEAKMGDLTVQDHKYYKKQRINYYWRTKPGEVLRYDKISRNIQMMNKNPDRYVKATLRAGLKPGTTDIILSPETEFPMHASASFDKEGGPSTGVSRKTVGGRYNNLLGMDDTFLSGYTWGRNFMGIYAYHAVPISPTGASFLYGWSYSESKPKKDYADFGLDSKSDNKTFSIHQDLFRKDEYLGEVSIALDFKDKLTKYNQGLLNRDKLRVVKAASNFVKRGAASSTSFNSEISQGIDAFCASSPHDPMLTRNAPPNFTKLYFSMNHRSVLPLGIQESFKLSGQTTFAKLPPQEQFTIGGLDSVRGYPAGDMMADNACLVNGELLLPSIFIPKDWRFPYADRSIRDQVTSVVFIDYGYGERRTESKSRNLLGIGAGLRISLYNQVLIRLEWGLPMADDPVGSGTRDPRFHVSFDVQERLPQELGRIWVELQEDNIKYLAQELVDAELARPDSPLRQKMSEDLYLAERYHEEGNLKEAQKIYMRIQETGKALYKQAIAYVRSCFERQKALEEDRAIALAAYDSGRIAEAKEMWQQIEKAARPRPLVLEF